MFLRFVVFLVFLSGASQSFGARFGKSPSLGMGGSYLIGVGMIDHNASKAATDASSGTKPFLSETYTQISLSAIYSATMNWSASPNFYYGITSRKSPEGNETTSIFGFGVRGLYNLSDHFDLSVGPGLLYYKISGSGGNVTLNNGSGTSTFATPSSSHTSAQLAWDLGAAYKYETYRLEFSVLVTSLFSSSKMAMNPLLTFTMEFL